jgi:hypothetical protein
MPDAVKNYMDAYNEAERHLADIKTLASALSNVAKVLASPGAVYQTVPSSWPTAQQISDLLSNARASLEKATMLYSYVPNELKDQIPSPDLIGLGKLGSNDNRNGGGRSH